MLMQEFEGKNKDEAIKLALDTLNRSEEQVRIEFVDEGKASFFGFKGGRPARIRVYYEEVESDFSIKARNSLKEMLDIIGIQADIVFQKEDNEKVYLKIISEDSGFIIGKKGKRLEAFQFLLNVISNKNKEQWKNIVLDIEGYRDKREQTLRRLALKTADIVRKTRKAKILEAMNPFERRLVHITLQDFKDIETKSEGEGVYKKIKISLK